MNEENEEAVVTKKIEPMQGEVAAGYCQLIQELTKSVWGGQEQKDETA